MTTLYKTKATALAGRNGNVATEDGLLNVDLSYPKEMGGSGTATNPEQLFAAGYAACFSNAILHVAKEAKVKIAQAPVSAEVGIGPNAEGGFELSVELAVSLDRQADHRVQPLASGRHHQRAYRNHFGRRGALTEPE